MVFLLSWGLGTDEPLRSWVILLIVFGIIMLNIYQNTHNFRSITLLQSALESYTEKYIKKISTKI